MKMSKTNLNMTNAVQKFSNENFVINSKFINNTKLRKNYKKEIKIKFLHSNFFNLNFHEIGLRVV